MNGHDRSMSRTWRCAAWLVTLGVAAACGGSRPGPGDPGYAYNVVGTYTGRLVVEGERFDARMVLRTASGGSVRGTFLVAAPFELEGEARGAVVDDLLRLTVRYESAERTRCDGSIEGILTVESGGGVIDGPVTITDCEGSLAGRMSFRR